MHLFKKEESMPSNTVETLPAIHDGRRPQLSPTLIIGGAFCLGLVVMLVLNRTELGLLLSQFGALWGIPQNRPIIVGLFVRIVFTAVVFAAIACACYLIVSVIKPDQEGSMRRITPSVVETKTRYPAAPVASAVNGSSPQPKVQPEAPPAETHHEAGQVAPVSDVVPESSLSSDVSHDETAPATDACITEQEATSVSIEIRLLKTIQMDLCIPGRNKRYKVSIDDLNSRARHLIAYIAAHKQAKLDEMRTHVFGSEEAETRLVQNAFSTAKRDIRRRINEAVEDARSTAGAQAVPDDLDLFVVGKNRKYSLPEYCHVTDLSFIEQQQHIIEEAEKSNELVDSVPRYVKDACDALISAYTGDFLEDLLVEDPDAIDPWVQSWAREPFTRYRDAYLQAILYAGEYERNAADAATNPSEKREHYANAARIFVQGAMAACNSRVCDGRFDTKVTFAKTGRRAGQHVTLSEQLIRWAIASYGKIGSTTLANRAYGAYEQQMLRVSGRAWIAQPETTRLLEDTLQQAESIR
jgi:hypothetical protein